jgi:molybdenum cofactor biosynthesis enzyme MoaA
MCERSHPEFKPQKNHLTKVLSKMIHLVPSLSQIHIQGIAEPFWKGLIWEVLDTLKFESFKHTVTISTTTNGLLLKDKTIDEFLRRVPHSIVTFSIDASTPETYKKIRIVDGFDLLVKNLMAYSKARCRTRQFLKIHNNINTVNLHEAKGMCQLAAKAQVEFVEFNPTDGFRHDILVNEKNCGLFKKAHLDIIAECDRLKVPLKFLRPLDLGLMDRLVQISL